MRFKKSSRITQTNKDAFEQWDAVGIFFEGDEIAVSGLNPWEHAWRVLADESLGLSHPRYPGQRHRMWIHEIEDERRLFLRQVSDRRTLEAFMRRGTVVHNYSRDSRAIPS